MFVWRKNVQKTSSKFSFQFSRGVSRYVSPANQPIYDATTPVAERLVATNLWNQRKSSKRPSKVKGDKTRVNIVEEKLCGMSGTFPYNIFVASTY
jgi:hypothetical protein